MFDKPPKPIPSTENKNISKEHKKGSLRLWLSNFTTFGPAVKDIKITGKENIRKIPEGAKVLVMPSHLNDLSVPATIHAVARDLDLVILNESTHHASGSQGEPIMKASMKIAGAEHFLPLDFEKDEKSGEKSPAAFNPENFIPAVEALEKGKSVLVAAHNPAREPLQNLDNIKGGYGGVYLAALTDAYILPVTVQLSRAVMDSKNLKTLMNRPNADIVIGEPLKLEKIEGIENLSSIMKRRKDGNKLTDEEVKEFSRIVNALREQSQVVMKHLSDQLVAHDE